MKTIGFIGMGNMAQAIVRGLHRAEAVKKENVLAFAPHLDKLHKNSEEIGFIACDTTAELIEKSDMIVLACKPYQIEKVVKENEEALKGKAIIGIAYGWNLEKTAQILPEGGQIFLPQPVTLNGFFFGEPLGFRLVGKFVDALHAGFFHSKTLLDQL